MFSLGLEFSLRKLVAGRRRRPGSSRSSSAASCSGSATWSAALFGWTVYESAVRRRAPSHLEHHDHRQGVRRAGRSRARSRDIVFGILIVEDLIAILLLTILTAVASGARLSAGALALTVGQLAGFLVVLLVGGLLIVPRLMRAVVRLRPHGDDAGGQRRARFAFALLARWHSATRSRSARSWPARWSPSRARRKIIEHLIEPVRDMFAAIFFVSVGMLIDPRAGLRSTGSPVLVLTRSS